MGSSASAPITDPHKLQRFLDGVKIKADALGSAMSRGDKRTEDQVGAQYDKMLMDMRLLSKPARESFKAAMELKIKKQAEKVEAMKKKEAALQSMIERNKRDLASVMSSVTQYNTLRSSTK